MKALAAALLTAALALSGLALTAGVPDPNWSSATIATPGRLMLLVRPDGQGPAFTAAYGPGGIRADATITLTLLDNDEQPIAGFPAEDIWLAPSVGSLAGCTNWGGLPPDRDTDANGQTTWSLPPAGGGFGPSRCQVFVNGDPLQTSLGFELSFTSPDLDGDLTVDLTDAGLFTADLFGPYAESSDFNFDGTINISDSGQIATALGHGCP